MSRVMRKPDLCLCENKGADQLRSNSDCTARFVSDLVGNPEDLFSRVAAHIISYRITKESKNPVTKLNPKY